MTFPHLRLSSRMIAMSYLCMAVLAPSMVGVAVLREATMRDEMDRETARQLYVQAIASGIAHSANAASAALSTLASDPSTSRAVSSGELDVVEMRFRRIMQAIGMKQIELTDSNGRPVLRVTNDEPGSAGSRDLGSDLRFHHAVRGTDSMVGEVVGTASITTLVDAAAYSQSLGRLILHSRGGRVLADPEAGGRGTILDIPESAGAMRAPIEAGVSTSGPGTSVAFAVAGDLPIVVTMTASVGGSPWPWWSLVVLDGLLLAVGWLVVSSATMKQAPVP
ncbi:cache domain-containing protein [Dokdonella fugitiva]|uniref:Two-component sensor kinase n=1 Tax=Dokdonella fugitiva TaxID=328517 RepID=A0A4R2I7B1_9GAMM|nr:cache domain-containing protein [Dokdonella fugitiva]TCO40211.1 two-component sensor kinase [Dokdonella fugitiva]